MADKTLEMEIKIAADSAIKAVNSLSSNIKQLTQQASSFTKNEGTSINSTMSQLAEQSKKAAAEFKLFGPSIETCRSQAAAYKEAATSLVAQGLKPESEEIQTLVSQYKNLSEQGDSLQSQQEGLFGVFQKMKGEIGSLAVVAAGVKFNKMISGVTEYSMEAADSFQNARNDFGVMLNDMQAGAAVFDNIVKPFNDFTPFDLDTTSQASKVLMSAKVQVKDLTTWLTRMGDLSQGNSQKMTSYVSAFSKASAKGKADMEVLNVYMDQGVPILDALGKHFGTTSDSITDMVSKGQVSFDDFKETLAEMTSEGGQFYGGMELSSKSYTSMQEGLKEATKSLAASLGEILLPAAKTVLQIFTNIVNLINNSPILKGVLAGAVAALAVAINAKLIVAVVSLIAKAWSAYAATMANASAMSILNPALLAGVIAVGAATTALVAYAAKQSEGTTSTNTTTLAIKEQQQAVEEARKALEGYTTDQLDFHMQQTTQEIEQAKKQLDELQKNSGSLSSIKFSVAGNGTATTGTEEQVQKLKDKIKQLESSLQTLQEVADEKKTKAELENADTLLKKRDKLYKKTEEYKEQSLKDQLEFAKSLQTVKTRNADGTETGFDSAKTKAIISMAQKELDEFYAKQKKNASELESANQKAILALQNAGWIEKIESQGETSVEKLKKQQQSSLEELQKKGFAAYGITFTTQEDYTRQEFALKFYYQKLISDQEKKDSETIHEQRMNAYKKEAEEKAEAAASKILSSTSFKDTTAATGDYASSYAQTQTSDTDIGQVAASDDIGGGIIIQFVKAIADTALALENVQKSLNFVQTIVDKMFEIIGPMLNDWLQPLVDILETIGTVLGEILAPVIQTISICLLPIQIVLKVIEALLQLVGEAFAWLNNECIVPFGNAVIDIINGLIDVINMIPGVDIDKISRLSLVGEAAEEQAEEMEKITDEIKSKYQRQEDRVNDLLDSQLSSLQSQYELGLISRSDYETQAESYSAAADSEIYDIEQEMEKALDAIEENTGDISSTETANADSLNSWFSALGGWFGSLWDMVKSGFSNIFSGIGSAVSDAWDSTTDFVSGVWDGITSGVSTAAGWVSDTVSNAASAVGDWVDSWWPFASGTSDIPSDMPAFVHKGEGIIPSTFNQAIKSGDYALVGGSKGGASSSSNVFSINVNVTGSVVTEKELTKAIYDGISSGIEKGTLTALPTEAA